MKSIKLLAPGQLALRTVDDPTPAAGELVLAVEAATTCGTDLKMYRRGHPRLPVPALFGHEYAGTVVAVGAGVERFEVGQAIMAAPTAPCGLCRSCRRGLENLCASLIETFAFGAYSERVVLPARIVARNVFPKPPRLPFAEAALLEPLSCVVAGVRRLELDRLRARLATAGPLGEPVAPSVLVIGAGAVGLMFVALLARSHGCRVAVAARRPERRRLAERLGALVTLDPASPDGGLAPGARAFGGGHGVDIVIEATGDPAVWETCPTYADVGGQVLYYGGVAAGTAVRVDAERLHYDQLTLKGAFHFAPADVAEAARLLQAGTLSLELLLAPERYTLEDVPELFARLDRGLPGVKHVVVPNGERSAHQ